MKPVLDEFGLEDHVAKNDFKCIDKLLAEHLSGEWPPFCLTVKGLNPGESMLWFE